MTTTDHSHDHDQEPDQEEVMGREEALARAAVTQWVARQARTSLDTAKQALRDHHLRPGDRVHASLGGLDVGTVSLTSPLTREVPTVTDEHAYTAWLAENQPDAVRTVTVAADWATAESYLTSVIRSTGEVPPGVHVEERTGQPTVQVRLSQDQAANLAALASGPAIAAYLTTGQEEDE